MRFGNKMKTAKKPHIFFIAGQVLLYPCENPREIRQLGGGTEDTLRRQGHPGQIIEKSSAGTTRRSLRTGQYS